MQRHDKILVLGAVGFLVYVLALSFLGPVLSSLLASKTLGNSGTVKAIGVGVYSNQQCTTVLSSLNWGTLEPGQLMNISCYVRNEGNSVLTLSMSTSNWNPSGAAQYITLVWDQEGKSLNPSQVVKTTFTLSVSSTIQGVNTFSFVVTIVGSG